MDTENSIEYEADYDSLTPTQKLKAEMYGTMGKICNELSEKLEMNFSKQVVATLTELTFNQCEIFAEDLEHFAKHAKRSTVLPDDVKLLARRSSSMSQHIKDMSEKLQAETASKRAAKKQKKSNKNMSENDNNPAVQRPVRAVEDQDEPMDHEDTTHQTETNEQCI